MKKVLSFVLVLALCLSLCACFGTTAEKELQGTWEHENGMATYIFFEGRFSCETIVAGMSLGIKEGSYEISDTAIVLHYDNGVDAELSYTFNSGLLQIENLIKK